MTTSARNEVAIVALQPADQEMMISLLGNAGYTAGVCADPMLLEQRRDSVHAAVICHRVSDGELSCQVSGLLPGKRVLVFSDCQAEQTVLSALESGAHHFFSIGESPRVMQARITAALRQHSSAQERTLTKLPFEFDLNRRSVTWDGEAVDLSPKEYCFACYLFSNPGRIVSIEELLTSVWSQPLSTNPRRIDTAACKLRKKMSLSEDSRSGWVLRRVRGRGYHLVDTRLQLEKAG